jgi:hypothetical protein
LSTTETLSNADIVLQSPEHFGKFVAHEVASALNRLWQPAEPDKEHEKIAAPEPQAAHVAALGPRADYRSLRKALKL